MDLNWFFWLITTTLMLLHQLQAFSVLSPRAQEGPRAEEGPLAQLRHTAHRREKRCSCENQKDKECIFFCHIGIVWVNTPSHVVPYGFGPVRLRRQVSRCFCSNTQDSKCVVFCSQQHIQPQVKEKSYRSAFWEKRSHHQLENQT